jgi:hypothetical protein
MESFISSRRALLYVIIMLILVTVGSSTSTIECAGDLSYDMSEVPVVNSSLQQSKLGIP